MDEEGKENLRDRMSKGGKMMSECMDERGGRKD